MEKKTPDAMKLGEIIHLIFEYNMTNTSGKLLDLVIADADESALRQYRKTVKAKMEEVEREIQENAKQLNNSTCDFVKIKDNGEVIAGNFDENIQMSHKMGVSQLHESYNRAVRRG